VRNATNTAPGIAEIDCGITGISAPENVFFVREAGPAPRNGTEIMLLWYLLRQALGQVAA